MGEKVKGQRETNRERDTCTKRKRKKEGSHQFIHVEQGHKRHMFVQ